MKIAIFGGTFDPPHLGHLAFAQHALDALAPDRTFWLPAGRPWQKADQQLAPAEHRVEMIQLLIAGESRFQIDLRELRRVGPSFTVDTLGEYSREYPGAELLFLIGQDQYARMSTWFQIERVLQLATLVVVPRDGIEVQPMTSLPPHRLELLALPRLPISSTAVRDAVARGEDIRPLVGPDVASYIASHRLYVQKN